MTRSQVESAVVEGGGKGKSKEGEKDKKKGIELERAQTTRRGGNGWTGPTKRQQRAPEAPEERSDQ